MSFTYVPVSYVSAFAGRHKWNSFEDTFLLILKKYRKNDFVKLVETAEQDHIYKQNVDLIRKKFPDLDYNEELSATQNYNKLILNKKVCKYLNKLEIKEVKVEKKIQEQIEEEVKEKIVEKAEYKEFIKDSKGDIKVPIIEDHAPEIVKSIVLKDRGTLLEDDTIGFIRSWPKILKNRHGKYDVQEQVYVKKYFSTDKNSNPLGYEKYPKVKGIIYTISGKIDALLPDCILEIKNRQNHFMEPQYDIDQLITYIIILGLNGRLIQQFQDYIKIGRRIKYKNAEKEWIESLKPSLDKAIIKANCILKSTNSKETIDLVNNHTISI
jgi:hypothetical protein